MSDKWTEMLLDIHEEHREDWLKIMEKVWEDRDNNRLDIPFKLKETQYHYNTKGEIPANQWALSAGKVTRKCNVGRVVDKFAFSYDRPVQELEFSVYRSVVADILKKSVEDNNFAHVYDDEMLKDLQVSPNKVVIASQSFAKKVNFEVDFIDKSFNDALLIIDSIRDLEVEWSWRPVFFYGPKDSTSNEYRYILSRQHIDTSKYKGFAYFKGQK